ncbi:MAG: polyribonucleotide nucleotidyltransferase [Erysipelotrichaceae bacterium]|jgi:polyribonucleotide nucleotidyltransferase|nr:polyribonucleotide nucleotidyltransferase [Erysipelotrichaceae bacterium]
MKKVFDLEFEGKKLRVEIGQLAKQADGAVLVRLDETAVLSTVCASQKPKEGDFFPLTVNYEEKQYSVGKIPGSFLRREGQASEHATLTGRLIDRPIRPMFEEGFRNEVQIVNTVLSVDYDATPEMSAMFGSSLALCISDIPFDGPIAGVYVGRVDGKLIINPTALQKEQSDLQLAVAGTKIAINMVEAGAAELSETEMLEALMFGHEAIIKLCEFQERIVKEVGKPKRQIDLFKIPETLVKEIETKAKNRLIAAISTFDKLERQHKITAIEEEVIAYYDAEVTYKDTKEHDQTVSMVKNVLEQLVADEVRRLITDEKIRPDGRKVDEIRPLAAEVDLLPRVHGSALFTRGQTQVLSVTTLGSLKDEQIIDNLTEEDTRKFLHHYNFPPYSVGEVGRMGRPGRREVGHGALGERALSYVIPSIETFPYTIRVVSEVLESNGSSSQASICAGCMSLMAAGVPIKDVVSGIAMGLVSSGPLDGKYPYTILTDIQGLEDHFGDMDFKVAGTKNGITALQMDIKIRGISKEILKEALEQAKVARAAIREVMLGAINEPRPEVGKYAPKMNHFMIDKDKIREVIGQGGKVINGIIDAADGVKIDIEDDGSVTIYHMDRAAIDKATQMIMDIVKVAEVGEIYVGKVTRVEDYGAFVNLFGNVDGLCHVSRLAWGYVAKASDIVKVGDELKVIVTEIDAQGKIKVSHKEFVPHDPSDEIKDVKRDEKKDGRRPFRKPFNKK